MAVMAGAGEDYPSRIAMVAICYNSTTVPEPWGMPKPEPLHQGLEGLAAENFGPGGEGSGPHCLPATQLRLWALLWARRSFRPIIAVNSAF